MSGRSFQGNNLWHQDGWLHFLQQQQPFVAGNRRVTGLLVQAVIATMDEQAKKITPLTETKTSQIEKPRKRTLWCRPRRLIESQSRRNEAQKNPQQRALGNEDGDGDGEKVMLQWRWAMRLSTELAYDDNYLQFKDIEE